VVACGSLGPGVGSASPRITLTSSSASASPTATPLAPLPDGCTTANSTTRVVLEHLFALTTSGDAQKVADCYARTYRDARPTFPAAAAAWASSGPATVGSVQLIDRVNDCDRFEVVAELARGESFGWQGRQRVFYSVGLESGVPRVFDSGSALAAPEVSRVVCR
jgi:hypothetical protein